MSAADPIQRQLGVAVAHASFAGHFPDNPILPGAVLLDAALGEIARERGIDLRTWRVSSAKFLGIVRPGAALRLEYASFDAKTIRFFIHCEGRRVTAGTLTHGA